MNRLSAARIMMCVGGGLLALKAIVVMCEWGTSNVAMFNNPHVLESIKREKVDRYAKELKHQVENGEFKKEEMQNGRVGGRVHTKLPEALKPFEGFGAVDPAWAFELSTYYLTSPDPFAMIFLSCFQGRVILVNWLFNILMAIFIGGLALGQASCGKKSLNKLTGLCAKIHFGFVLLVYLGVVVFYLGFWSFVTKGLERMIQEAIKGAGQQKGYLDFAIEVPYENVFPEYVTLREHTRGGLVGGFLTVLMYVLIIVATSFYDAEYQEEEEAEAADDRLGLLESQESQEY